MREQAIEMWRRLVAQLQLNPIEKALTLAALKRMTSWDNAAKVNMEIALMVGSAAMHAKVVSFSITSARPTAIPPKRPLSSSQTSRQSSSRLPSTTPDVLAGSRSSPYPTTK